MQLDDGRRITKVVYTVRNNRNQFLRLTMPDKAEIWSVAVGSNPVSPAKDETGKVLIPLIRSAAGARELSSFPVELVYVETSENKPQAAGKLRVELPVLEQTPALTEMYNFYLPAEGNYTLGWGKSAFSGPLRIVEEFTKMATGPGAEVVERNIAGQAKQMQQEFDTRMDQQARATGATPIHVRLPINGKLFKLEKVLVLPKDVLWFEVQYSGWKLAQ
jgi:hypothetical protein